MRRNFAQILKEAQIDIKLEYQKLYGMLYDHSIQVSDGKLISAYDEISDYFTTFYFRGTCLSIDEFNNMHGFHFERYPADFNIYHLINLCEYIYNMLIGYNSVVGSNVWMNLPINVQFYWSQINTVIDKIGYMQTSQDGFCIFVEKSPAAISVAENQLIPDELSYKIISYNHHSMKGQVEAKKSVLLQLASILEGKRGKLKNCSSSLEQDLFYAFNNLNLRHNNTNHDNAPKYKPYVAEMNSEDLEFWYDECYQMCLLAFMELEHSERKPKFDSLKANIEQR